MLGFAFIPQKIFEVTPLNYQEWIAVMKFSIPVLLIDETLKLASREEFQPKKMLKGAWEVLIMWGVYVAVMILWDGSEPSNADNSSTT